MIRFAMQVLIFRAFKKDNINYRSIEENNTIVVWVNTIVVWENTIVVWVNHVSHTD